MTSSIERGHWRSAGRSRKKPTQILVLPRLIELFKRFGVKVEE